MTPVKDLYYKFKKVDEMDKEELLKLVETLYNRLEQQREDHRHETKMLSSIRRLKSL